MNGPVPLCSKCHTWHAQSENCPALAPQSAQPRNPQDDQKVVDDAEQAEIDEWKAYRKGKQP